MNLQLKITGDGSHTLYLPDLDEHYHSIYGAWQESEHVFIREGLNQVLKPAIKIFEVGFGTGLNALLTCREAAVLRKKIGYFSIELYPLENEITDQLNYPQMSSPDMANIFSKLHSCKWNERCLINRYFDITKIEADITKYSLTGSFDLVYFDVFAPGKQPELWEPQIFIKLYNALLPGGILVTYSSSGEVRRNLEKSGFAVQRIPGPPGKRQMIRAVKPDG